MKKAISMICLFALLISIAPISALPVQASSVTGSVTPYQVGYARVDINPYVVEDDPSSGIMALPLRGFGDVWNRLSVDTLLDDNGDGKVDANDGLKATCIAISDDEGKTVLMITADLIGGTMVDKIRPAVIESVDAAIASGEVKNVQPLTNADVYYAGTHTHSGPDTTVYTSKGKTGTNNDGVSLSVVNENLGIWIERTVEDICDAVIASLKDRASAQLEKDQLSLSCATSAVLKDKSMVSTRHYNTEVDGDRFVAGDGFNAVKKSWYADPTDYQTTRGADPKQVTQADDNIYLLKFAFSDSTKLPIILTSWRGHPSLNASDTYPNSGNYYISSDYVNAYRHGLEYGCDVSFNGTNGYITDWKLGTIQKYRVAFFNATGGNTNPRNFERITYHGTDGDLTQRGYAWIEDAAKNASIKGQGCTFGVALAVLAQECINDGLNEIPVNNGRIQTSQLTYYAEKKTTGIHEMSYKAAVAHNAENAVKTVTYPFKYTDPDTGEVFLIGNRFQPSAVISAWDKVLGIPKTGSVKVELGAVLLGQDVAFVSIPGEPFDYYYKDTTVIGDERYAPENNLWNELVHSDTYGKPFVLGYCNGAVGYFVNYDTYNYNQGSTKYVVGSYEAQTTPVEQGTGEKMLRIFDDMLTSMSEHGSLNHDAPCDHCGEGQLWQPYNGQTELTTGHYYLCADTQTTQIKIAGGQQVCIDLKGHTLTGTSRAIYTSDTTRDVLSIMDSSEAQNGIVQGSGSATGAASGFGGGTIIVSEGDELNLYSGTLTYKERKAYSCSTGGVLRIKGTFNMYGGKVTGGIASSFTGSYYSGSTVKTATRTGSGGNISVTGTMNLYGGQIADSKLTAIAGTVTKKDDGSYSYTEEFQTTEGQGSSVRVENTGKVNLYGNASVEQLHLAEGGTLSVMGVYTGSAELKFDGLSELSEGTVVGISGENADASQAVITFSDAPGLTAAVKESELVVSAVPYTFGSCEACGDCRWIPVTDAQMDAWNKLDMPPGHYVLTEDVSTVQKQLNGDGKQPGTYCIDLNGHTFTGTTRAFLVYEDAALNIIDRAGGGIVEGMSGATIGGGVLYASKNAVINLYGGTIRHNTDNSNHTKNGAVLKINSGIFRMYGGTVEGGNVSDNGGAINVTKEAGSAGTFMALGGMVTMGSAQGSGDCVFVANGCNVVLNGNAQVAEIFFEDSSANTLTVDNDYTGSVTLRYAEEPDDLQDIGNCTGNDIFNANIVFYHAPDKTVAVKDTDLLVSDSACVFGICDACGECVWIPITNTQLDAWNKYDMPPGHYILIQDVTTVQKQLNYNGDFPGTFCIDLAGHSYTGATRSFVVYEDAWLNIIDSVGTGVMHGQMMTGSGGVISVSKGRVDMYGGTLQQLNTKSNKILSAGAVRVNGGSFHLHGGVINGFPVSTYGGAIYVTSASDAPGSLFLNGGQVLAGTADTSGDCIYISKDCSVTLSADPDIARITFAGSSADSLILNGFIGKAELEYPDTVSLENGTVLGTIVPPADLKEANLSVKTATCAVPAVKEGTLVLTEAPEQHIYQTEIIDPTCTEAGFTTYICTLCGKEYTSNELAPLGHSYQSMVTTQPDCETEGEETFTCGRCGHVYTAPVPATGHSYEADVTAPTCTEAGFTTYTCHCGHSYTADEVPADGHRYLGGVCSTCHACEACGSCNWTPIGDAELDAWNKFDMPPGHYILTEDVSTVQKQINGDGAHPGSFCIDLNGHTFTGETRAFLVYSDAQVNILDSVGTGILQGQMVTGSGGVIYVSKGQVDMYGGTLQQLNSKSDQILSGGTVRVNGGNFNLHGGTIRGFSVSTSGGTIYVSNAGGVAGSLHISGGQVFSGKADTSGDCIYISKGGSVALSGDADIAGITFAENSADTLALDATFTGTVELEYPDTVSLHEGVVVGAAQGHQGTVTLKGYSCRVPTVKNGELIITVNDRHTYQSEITVPTCTESGFTTYTCRCGDTYISDELPPLDHRYETVATEPTCTQDGGITLNCTVCGYSKTGIIPATGHSFVDGICGACGEADPDYVKPVTQPTLKLKAPALEFKDMIKVIAFFTAENLDSVVEMGMITYTENVEVVDITTAAHVIPGAEYDAGTGRYYSSSQGIHAKYLGDDVYLAIYAKLSDGSYVYTRLVSYSPITYASNQLKNSTDMNLKQLVAAMLNYGAAAQNYFGYKTDALANATMTEEQINLPEAYRADMVNTVASPSKDKQGSFANNKGFGTRRPAVSFEGAFSINYFFTPNYTPVDGITMYYWTEAAFIAVDVLTVENASGSVQMTGEGVGQYRGDIEGIAAKSLSEAVYVAAVYSDGTTSWTSGVLGYSIGAYCSSQATKGGTMADLAMATAVYGYHAKRYFC